MCINSIHFYILFYKMGNHTRTLYKKIHGWINNVQAYSIDNQQYLTVKNTLREIEQTPGIFTIKHFLFVLKKNMLYPWVYFSRYSPGCYCTYIIWYLRIRCARVDQSCYFIVYIDSSLQLIFFLHTSVT